MNVTSEDVRCITKRKAMLFRCDTCIVVMKIYGSTESVVPWLCTCSKKTAQSPLPVTAGSYQSNIAEARLALAIKARRA